MKKKWIIGLLVIAVLISGCTTTTTTQTNPPPSPVATTASTTQPTATATTTEQQTATATTTMQPTPTPAIVSVNIKSYTFVPATVTIQKGTTVTWTNGDSVPHTVTSVSREFDSGSIDPGKTWSYVFNQGGTFEYSCSIHTTMPHGKVIVT